MHGKSTALRLSTIHDKACIANIQVNLADAHNTMGEQSWLLLGGQTSQVHEHNLGQRRVTCKEGDMDIYRVKCEG